VGDKFGGRTAPTPQAAAEGQDFVMACVGNDDDLRAITIAAGGAFAAMKAGAVFVDHTTAQPRSRVNSTPRRPGTASDLYDAPVSAGRPGRKTGLEP